MKIEFTITSTHAVENATVVDARPSDMFMGIQTKICRRRTGLIKGGSNASI
jgi:hypothetical protein